MGRMPLRALDLRFAEPKIEALYHNYYAQVKAILLPTAIQVLLLVGLLHLLATCLHLYLQTDAPGQPVPAHAQLGPASPASQASDRWLAQWLPLSLQLLVLLTGCAMLRLVRARLLLARHRAGSSAAPSRPASDQLSDTMALSMESGQQSGRPHRTCSLDSSGSGGSSGCEAACSLVSGVSGVSGANNVEQHQLRRPSSGATPPASRRPRRRRNRAARRRNSGPPEPPDLQATAGWLPYLLFGCQLLQLTSGLSPEYSFISYASLLLYSYTIYVIFPIRLLSCSLLAVSLAFAQPLTDYLLLYWLRQTGASSDQQQTALIISMSSNSAKLLSFGLLLVGANVIGLMSFFFYERQQRAAFLETRQSLETKLVLEQESREQERLLLSILPEHLAKEIRKDLGAVVGGQFKKIYMSRHENVSILFADIVGFTAISSNCPAPELVQTLNELFARFDELAEQYHQLRIKILGDCYYAISGAPVERPDHAVLCVHMGLSMVEAIRCVRERTKSTVDMRVGVHTGAVLAGVLGQRQWQFDVYSKDVELANRMESSGLPGRVHISDATLRFLNHEFQLSPGNGASREEALRLANMQTYFIERVLKPYPEGTLDAGPPTAAGHAQPAPKAPAEAKETAGEQPPANAGIKLLSLNFTDRHLELQFRSSSDIASCVSLVGLPVALVCACLAHLCLYGSSQCLPVYGLAICLLLLAVLFCLLPYLRASVTHQTLTGGLLIRLAGSVNRQAWMKLALASLMTFIWFLAHFYAVTRTSQQLDQLTSSRALQLFSVDLFNYFSLVCALAITAITRISYLVKTAVIVCVILLQVILNISLLAPQLAARLAAEPSYDQYVFALTLATTCWALFLINRQSELTNRHLFLWRKQVEERKEKVADLRKKNEALVYNILPPNVAKIFLGKRNFKDKELYSKSYEAVGVLFAAMPNFSDFYTEESVNNQGLECLRFLNEVISDYDALLDKPQFKNIIKIKTMGSTYMAASGLYEGDAFEESKGSAEQELSELDKWAHLEQLTEFALALKDTLNNINKDSFNNFVLRIGINQGPIIAGVIGAKKPHFDMWGNTVNVASRMESTGSAGSIQVVSETANILRLFGFQFEQRGLVSVKGKGKLLTFYLTGRQPRPPPPPPPPPDLPSPSLGAAACPRTGPALQCVLSLPADRHSRSSLASAL